MANLSLYSPNNPHFFQPLLPGFHTHLNIPITFYTRHVQGRNHHNKKTAKLRSDASNKTWTVKIDGLKLTNGWEDFAVAHDLRIGDIIVFRHEGDMEFHVTALGPSCCEISYTSSSYNINNSDDQTNIGNSLREKRNREVSSSDQTRFVAKVSTSSLINDRLYLPQIFVIANGMNKMNGTEIVLMNEEGRTLNSKLLYNKVTTQTFVKPGWRRFCAENGMSQGQNFPFKLVRKSGGPPVVQLCRREHIPESDSDCSFFGGSVTASSLINDKQYLPKKFVSENGLNKGCSEITLKDKYERRWTLSLKHYESCNLTILRRGWTSFCKSNGIKAKDSFKFKLVRTGDKPVLSLCPVDSNHDKTSLECSEANDVVFVSSDSNESEESEEERFEKEKKKYFSRCRGSCSYSQNQFVTLTFTSYSYRFNELILPLSFTEVNGMEKVRKITLLGQDNVNLVVELLKDVRSRGMRLGNGWREFCESQGMKIDESCVLELIWEEEDSPVLKFCTKVNSV